MLVEQRTCTCYCGKAQQYVKMYEAEGLAIQRPTLGELNRLFTIGLSAARGLLFHPGWQSYAARVQPLVLTQDNERLT